MDAQLTFLYYLTAFVAAVVPLASGLTLALLIDRVVVTSAHVAIPVIVVIVVATHFAIVAINAAVRFGLHEQYYDYVFRYRLQDTFTYRFCEKLTQLDVPHLEDPEVQTLIAKVRDTHAWRVPDFFRMLAYAFIAVVGVVAAGGALIRYGGWIVLVVLGATLPRIILRLRFGEMQWSMYGSGAPESRKLWYFGDLLSQISALRELKVFRTAPSLLARYRAIQARIFALGKRPLDRYRRVSVITPLIEGAVVFAVAWSVLPAVTAGALSVGSFAFFVTMLQQLATSSAEAGGCCSMVYQNLLYVRHWNELMALPRVIPIAERPHRFARIAPPRIEFRDVSFHYPSGRPALHGVSFVIEPGESVALVGANGAGKSTLIKLLCRFYDVTRGQILINGVDLRELDPAHWHAHLGTLFQDFVQYKLTVRDNVLLGDPGRVDEAAMVEAVRKAGATELVRALPGGYDQILGTEFADGEQLSGGQWQKLAIARAFYQSAAVLIMDEPTSAIDAEAEYEIFNNLEAEYRDKTLILVSHRFSTVRNADRILVIEDGRIVEHGTHGQLLAAGGRYAAMFTAQAAGYR
ncbi:MAG TPA: ABC transporter ATP-binding protein [Kofleriaceae bacterium]|nr:ABC transporter ATP-binding protein [Kofleriaceae bacterium]